METDSLHSEQIVLDAVVSPVVGGGGYRRN
jgi:hypothetical protein